MNASWKKLLTMAALSLGSTAVQADCRATSPDYSVALIELYTSEGCDSCPPADRWLSRLSDSSERKRAVPLALHVDYWDRLGWKDRFASAAFTERQYEEMRRQHSAFVYTPQILLQGRDYSQWRTGADPATAIAAINKRPSRAAIELAAQTQGEEASVDIHVSGPDSRDRA